MQEHESYKKYKENFSLDKYGENVEKKDTADKTKIYIEDSKDSYKIIKIEMEGSQYYLNNKYNVEKGVNEWIESVGDIEDNSVIFLFGISNGMYLKKLIDNTSEDNYIIVYEPNKEIFTAFMTIAKEDVFLNRVVYCVKGYNDELYLDFVHTILNYSNLSIAKYLCSPNYDIVFKKEYKEYLEKIKMVAEIIIINRNTEIRFAKSHILNILSNIKHIMKSSTVNQLTNLIPSNIPAIIVAAGPSLSKNIRYLKEISQKAFIIATDTALMPLLKEDIIPHIFLTIDPEKELLLFEDERIFDIPMIAYELSNKIILNRHKGKKFFSTGKNKFTDKIYTSYNKEINYLETGGSVANNAFSFAKMIGLNTIILIGQDLAYTNGKGYAKGISENKQQEDYEDKSKFVEVEDINGNPVLTLPVLKKYIEWFEHMAEKNKNMRIIDATEGGAKIIGCEIMTLQEAINDTCKDTVDIHSIIQGVPYCFNEKERKDIEKKLVTLPQHLVQIKRKAQNGKKDYKRLLNLFKEESYQSKKFKNTLNKLKKLNKDLDDDADMGLILPYIKEVEYNILGNIYKLEDTIKEDGMAIAQKGIAMMEAIIVGIDDLMPEIEAILQKTD